MNKYISKKLKELEKEITQSQYFSLKDRVLQNLSYFKPLKGAIAFASAGLGLDIIFGYPTHSYSLYGIPAFTAAGFFLGLFLDLISEKQNM